MTNPSIKLDVSKEGRWINIQGDLNYATIEEARGELLPALSASTGPVVLDMRQLDFIGSVGVELLLEAAALEEDTKAILLLNELVAGVLKVSGVLDRFNVAPAEDAAARSAGLTP